MKFILIFAVLLCVGIAPSAAGAKIFETLYTETSNTGESLDDFISRIASRAVAESDSRRSEVCGALRSSENYWTVTMVTSRKRKSCTMPKDYPNQPTFHTHPDVVGGRDFSRADYATPGYLAAGGRVMHQAGWGTERVLLPVESRSLAVGAHVSSP